MFEKTLSDLVRGIRAHRGTEAQYISQCMAEIKKELKQENMGVKANAISKLTYLQMLGYDISWAAFNIIEVMSSSKFTYKRIGYLAATQCFHDGLDVVMLTTNMIKKDMSSGNQYDSGLALNGLSCFITPDLARDLANDVLTVTSSVKPYLKRKAVIVLYKVFLKFPDALRPAFPRLKQCLEDPDSGVQCAAVSVICELAQKNPKNYLSLAPTLFKLMNSSSNNWMLIKIIKLFGALCPLEPRLGKKLVDPLTSLIHSTSAMSLLYECINTVVVSMPSNSSCIQLSVSKLRLFMEDADQNLKYLGLLAMSRIMQQQPKAVLQVKDIIMDCIEDKDESIRVRALELITGMANKKNIVEIVKKLIVHINSTESTFFRDNVLEKIIVMCSQKSYQFITNFEWYITVLVEMTQFEGTRHGKLIASELLNVTIRVKDVRPFSIRQMATIVKNCHLFAKGAKDGVSEVLYAAAWIVGEFSEHLDDPLPVLEALINPRVTSLPGHIQAIFVQNIIKLYASIIVKAEAEGNPESTEEVGAMLVEKLPVFMQSGDLEVQERACCILQLMKYIVKLQSKGAAVAEELTGLFAEELNPVAVKAQRKVPVPDGLDLDKWINDPPSDDDDLPEEDDSKGNFFFSSSTTNIDRHRGLGEDSPPASSSHTKKGRKKDKRSRKAERREEEEMEQARERRRQQQLSNPHYLKPSSPTLTRSKDDEEDLEVGKPALPATKDIPVTKLELGIPLLIERPKVDSPKTRKGKKGKKGRKGRKGAYSDEDEAFVRPKVDTSMGQMPDGALPSDEEGEVATRGKDDVFKKLDVNLDAPLRDDEVLPVRTHRTARAPSPRQDEDESAPKKGKGKDKHKRKSKKAAMEDEEEEETGKRKSKKKSSKKKRSKAAEDDEEQEEDSGLLDLSSTAEPPKPAAADSKPKRDKKEKSPAVKKTEGDVDDLEFWLTPAAGDKEDSKDPASSASASKKPKEETRPEQLPDIASVETTPKSKKTKKSKGEKKSKKGKKKEAVREDDELTGEGSGLLELVEPPQEEQPPLTTFTTLAVDNNLELTYDIKGDSLHSTQVTVAVVFRNLSENTLLSMDFNVLDSLNVKLERPAGLSSHDGIPVPFQLPPGTANECQFLFYVKEFYVHQKLRGTVTYMMKSSDGTAQDKMDFKLQMPSSGFICPRPCSQDHFAALLSGGSLCETQSLKVALKNTPNFQFALNVISLRLHLKMVELIADSASLYGCSIAGHHICFLIKAQGDQQLQVSAKGSDARLVSSLLDELKALV